MAKTRPPYTPEFRHQMVELVRAGRSPEELAQEFEPTAQSIGRPSGTPCGNRTCRGLTGRIQTPCRSSTAHRSPSTRRRRTLRIAWQPAQA
jgi:hypothetical protein